MEVVAFLEELGRRGTTLRRHPIHALPATVGRGYEADVYLADPYVDPLHLRIERADDEAGMILTDLTTTNGTRVQGRVLAGPEYVQGPVRIRMGRTATRLVPAGVAVAPTLVESREPLFGVGRTKRGVLMSAAVGVAVVTASLVLGTAEPWGAEVWLTNAFVAALMIALWAGAWAVVNRLVQGRSNFAGHCAVASVVFALWTIVGNALTWGQFLAPGHWVPEWLNWGVSLGLGTVLLHAHLALASRLKQGDLWRWAGGVVVGLTVVALLLDSTLEDAGIDAVALGAVQPAPASWIPAASLEDFGGELTSLQATLEELAEEADEP